MRIALAGAGAFGIRHLDGLANIDGVTVTAIVSRRLEQAEEVARKYGAGPGKSDPHVWLPSCRYESVGRSTMCPTAVLDPGTW